MKNGGSFRVELVKDEVKPVAGRLPYSLFGEDVL